MRPLFSASWSHFDYSPLIIRGSAGREQWSQFGYSSLITRGSVGRAQLVSHFCYSPLITRGSAGMIQLVTLLLLSSHNPWISWQSVADQTSVTLHSSSLVSCQSTAGHTSVTLHSPPVDQLAEHSWSLLDYYLLITCGSADRAQLVTLLLLSTHQPWTSCALPADPWLMSGE